MEGARTTCWNDMLGTISTADCTFCHVGPFKSLPEKTYINFNYRQHGNELLRGLCQQRKQGRHQDCIIRTAAESLAVSGSLLASFSEYVGACYKYANHPLMQPVLPAQKLNNAELQPLNINLEHLNSNAVKALIDCMYSGDLSVPDDEMKGIIEAANFLCITSVSQSPTSGQVQFNRSDYLEKLSADLIEQLRRREFVNCRVSIGSLEIYFDQSVLAAFSDFFDGSYSTEDYERNASFQSLHPPSVAALVTFAYSGYIFIESCALLEQVRAADFLGFEAVSNFCYKHLFSCLTTENCLRTYAHAELSKNKRHMNDVKQYILHNFSEVSQTDEFLELDVETLLQFLRDDELVMMKIFQYNETINKYFFIPPSEQELLIFECVQRYIKHHSIEDTYDMLRLVSGGVRLPLISLSDLLAIKENLRDNSCAVLKAMINGVISRLQLEITNTSDDLYDRFASHWITQRTLPHLAFNVMLYEISEENPPSPECEIFDDSTLFNLPVQFITGMKMYTRLYNGRSILSGLLVTYNGEKSILHGSEEESGPMVSFNLGSDERIIGIRGQVLLPETHLLHVLSVNTNKGGSYGYTVDGVLNDVIYAPEDSLYLAYIGGSVDMIEGKATLRDIAFWFAKDANESM